jgi:hypothetical protein
LSEIRPCLRDDIPAVAVLFQRTFRDARQKPPRALEEYIAEAHFDHPWFDPEIAPRVHVNGDGRVTGFIGVVPGHFEYRGQPVRAAIAGSLMVESPEREPLAGAKLMRALVKGPQDISISESTNAISQRLWERSGARVLPMLSLDWFRVLQPGAAALAALGELMPGAPALLPMARVGDFVGRRWTKRHFTPQKPASSLQRDTGASDAVFADAVLELVAENEFRPNWTCWDVRWLLRQAASKQRYGPVHRTIVRDGKGELVGCYIYHGKPDGIGRVLNILARPKMLEPVLDCLFFEAAEGGLAALRGRSNPGLVNALLLKRCVFAHRGSTVVYTLNHEIGAAVENGALITGLAGESWSRLIGDDFN